MVFYTRKSRRECETKQNSIWSQVSEQSHWKIESQSEKTGFFFLWHHTHFCDWRYLWLCDNDNFVKFLSNFFFSLLFFFYFYLFFFVFDFFFVPDRSPPTPFLVVAVRVVVSFSSGLNILLHWDQKDVCFSFFIMLLPFMINIIFKEKKLIFSPSRKKTGRKQQDERDEQNFSTFAGNPSSHHSSSFSSSSSSSLSPWKTFVAEQDIIERCTSRSRLQRPSSQQGFHSRQSSQQCSRSSSLQGPSSDSSQLCGRLFPFFFNCCGCVVFSLVSHLMTCFF